MRVSVRRKLRPKPTNAKREHRRTEMNHCGATKVPIVKEKVERPLMATIRKRAPTCEASQTTLAAVPDRASPTVSRDI